MNVASIELADPVELEELIYLSAMGVLLEGSI